MTNDRSVLSCSHTLPGTPLAREELSLNESNVFLRSENIFLHRSGSVRLRDWRMGVPPIRPPTTEIHSHPSVMLV